MSPRLRFLLNNEGLSVWSLRGRELHQLTRFPNSADGIEAFSRFAGTQRTARTCLLIDTDGQLLTTENLPKAGRRIFSRMLQARLQRLYPDTPWRCAQPLPASAGTERSVVFMGQARTPALQTWEKHLNAEAVLKPYRVCTPSLLLAHFIRRQNYQAERLIVVRQQGPDALQLCLLQHGLPVALQTSQQVSAGDFAETLSRFARLATSGHAPRETHAICLIGNAEWQESVQLPDDPLRIVTRHADSALDLLGISDRHWPTGFAHPATSGRKPGGRFWLVAIVAGAAATGVGTAVMARHEAWQDKLEDGKAQHRRLAEEIRRLEQHAVAVGMAAKHLDHLKQDRQHLLSRRNDLSPALLGLSHAMEDLPDLSLTALTWESLSSPLSGEGKWRMTLDGRIVGQDGKPFRQLLLDRLRAAAGANGEIVVKLEGGEP